jgi:hypothetical protein
VPATQESQARTRAFARVIGPWLVIVPGIIVLRGVGDGRVSIRILQERGGGDSALEEALTAELHP